VQHSGRWHIKCPELLKSDSKSKLVLKQRETRAVGGEDLFDLGSGALQSKKNSWSPSLNGTHTHTHIYIYSDVKRYHPLPCKCWPLSWSWRLKPRWILPGESSPVSPLVIQLYGKWPCFISKTSTFMAHVPWQSAVVALNSSNWPIMIYIIYIYYIYIL